MAVAYCECCFCKSYTIIPYRMDFISKIRMKFRLERVSVTLFSQLHFMGVSSFRIRIEFYNCSKHSCWNFALHAPKNSFMCLPIWCIGG